MTADPPISSDTLRDSFDTLCEQFNDDPPACPVERLLALDEIRRLRRQLEQAERKSTP
jgi:hypothetical protein